MLDQTIHQNPRVFGTGLLALDVVLSAQPNVAPRLAAGGTCGNVLTILSYLGWNAFPIARLGSDASSYLVRDDLERAGVSLRFASLGTPAETPVFIHRIRRNPAGEVSHRFSTNCPRCGAWLPSYRPVTAVAARQVMEDLEDDTTSGSPSVFFFDRASRGALVLAEWFKRRGALVVFEPAGKGDVRLLTEAVALADVLKYSADRISAAVRLECDWAPPALEIETRGAEGLRYRSHSTGGEWRTLSAAPAPSLADTAGAGDWCTAGMLFALQGDRNALQTHNVVQLERAIQFGQSLAAVACAHEGARGLMGAADPKDLVEFANNACAGKHDTQIEKRLRCSVSDTGVQQHREFSCSVCEPCGVTSGSPIEFSRRTDPLLA